MRDMIEGRGGKLKIYHEIYINDLYAKNIYQKPPRIKDSVGWLFGGKTVWGTE